MRRLRGYTASSYNLKLGGNLNTQEKKMTRLNREEQEILEKFDSGKLKRVEDATTAIKSHQSIAEATVHHFVDGQPVEKTNQG